MADIYYGQDYDQTLPRKVQIPPALQLTIRSLRRGQTESKSLMD